MDDVILPGYTRVTECLRGFSKYDLIPEDVLEKASDRGTRVHAFCEMYAKGLWCVVDEDCTSYVDAFRKWFDDNVKEVIFTEKRLYNDEYKLTGQIDLMVWLKSSDDPVIVDVKNTCNISKSWALQTAAYQYICGYNHCCKRIALNLPKEGKKTRIVEYNDYNNDLRMYLNCLELYRFLNPEKKNKEIEFPC